MTSLFFIPAYLNAGLFHGTIRDRRRDGYAKRFPLPLQEGLGDGGPARGKIKLFLSEIESPVPMIHGFFRDPFFFPGLNLSFRDTVFRNN